jgi:hypothetical protein
MPTGMAQKEMRMSLFRRTVLTFKNVDFSVQDNGGAWGEG